MNKAQEDFQKLSEFLDWLADLYDHHHLALLVARDGEVRSNFAEIRDIYERVLTPLESQIMTVGSLVKRRIPTRGISEVTGEVIEILECGRRARVQWDARRKGECSRTSKIKLSSLKLKQVNI